MNVTHTQTELPKSAVQEFKNASALKWDAGIPLDELLARVNRVAGKMVDTKQVSDSRVSQTFQPRTFRHYVGLGCIDQGRREGRRCLLYDYRHYLQALLVRRLLSERVPARRIPELIHGLSNEKTKRMLFYGVEMIARNTESETGSRASSEVISPKETWFRAELALGVELHVRSRRPTLKDSEFREVLAVVERLLKV